MSWLYGYFGGQNIKEKKLLRPHNYSFETSSIRVYAGGSGKNIKVFENPLNHLEKVFVLGDPILRKGLDFCYPDANDWYNLLLNEGNFANLEGHWLILIASRTEIRAYNDLLCKRSLLIHKGSDGYFICSELPLLKEAGLAKIDPRKFGIYWHSMFPPPKRRYAPSSDIWYQDVEMLFQNGSIKLSKKGLELECSPLQPDPEPLDLLKMLENFTLLPLRAGRRVCYGLSGGMDTRALLSIALKHKMPFSAVHFGDKNNPDYIIAERIAKDFKIPFRFIGISDVDWGWDNAREYLHARGFGFNPASSYLMSYYPIIGEDFDIFMCGYYGEMFRSRSMFAHFTSLATFKKPSYRSFARYVTQMPPSFFIPELRLEMYKAYMDSLQDIVSQLPPQGKMANPLWMDLLYVRYSSRSIVFPDICNLDLYICDHMPFLQSSILKQHWHYGLTAQLNEQPHRKLISNNTPQLAKYPLVLAGHTAPYLLKPYVLKLWVAAKQRRKPNIIHSRAKSFLWENKNKIWDLRHDKSIAEDPLLDLKLIDYYLNEYYKGNQAYCNSVLSFLSYALGK